jgi:hypothetical protein
VRSKPVAGALKRRGTYVRKLFYTWGLAQPGLDALRRIIKIKTTSCICGRSYRAWKNDSWITVPPLKMSPCSLCLASFIKILQQKADPG